MWTLVSLVANAIWDDEVEPWDFETEYLNFLAKHLDETDTKAIAYGLPYVPQASICTAAWGSRTCNEGVTNRRDDVILDKDELNWLEIGLQGAGFSPSDVAQQGEANRKFLDIKGDINEWRQRLLNRYALAVRTGDKEGKWEAWRRRSSGSTRGARASASHPRRSSSPGAAVRPRPITASTCQRASATSTSACSSPTRNWGARVQLHDRSSLQSSDRSQEMSAQQSR